MDGTTITLKNVPAELHKSLKLQAKAHKRSLNMEAIHCLEEVLRKSNGERQTLRKPPVPSTAGRILRPLGNRADRQSEFIEREA